MRICFPTDVLKGMESNVYGHFGTAPGFVIVDTETSAVEEINNSDQHHAHGMCQPIKALGGQKVDSIAVGGIGMGALMGLQNNGMKVFRAVAGTVRDNLELLQNGKLPEFSAQHTCAGHSGGGCSHHH
ncbi:MAG: NifB/NifX family molybdenum-iron cluster-binding protein [Syntrophobacteraceae bacterium]|jgi:predicted Fe-Mo cluster-binding NifX family protein